MKVAEYVAMFLAERGLKHAFGYQGGAILKLVQEFRHVGGIEFVQTYHEQGAAFAADAYARVTGRFGVAMATSGPGATNLLTGIVNAQLDSIPTIFITGQDYVANITARNGARQNGFQDLDIASVVRTVCKYSALVTDPTLIRYELECAYHNATQGRPGAVLLDIPIDVQFAEIEPNDLAPFSPPMNASLKSTEWGVVMELLSKASRPIALVGGGVRLSRATDQLQHFAEVSGIPIVTTLNGLDAIHGSLGFSGLHGRTAANLAIQNADILLVLGARLGQRQVGKTPSSYTSARVIHVDVDPAELGRVFGDEVAVKMDLREFLIELTDRLMVSPLGGFVDWKKRLDYWQEKYRNTALLNSLGVDPVAVVREIMPLLESDAILVCDVGQNQMWVAQGYTGKQGQRLLNSVGLGSMGYSLPAAIGAKIASPQSQVIAFMGDGGLQINLQELMLIAHRKLAIKCIVFNNKTLGMIREVQLRYYGGSYLGTSESEYTCVNLASLAATYGLRYRCIASLEDAASLHNELADPYPYIIEVPVDLNSKLSNRYDESEYFKAEQRDA